MIRVAHLITSLTLGGAQETVFYYYNNMNRKTYDFYFLAGGKGEFESDSYIKKLEKDSKYIVIKNLFKRINLWKDLLAFIEIYNFLRKNRIQIIHTHSSKSGIIGRIAAKMAGVPVIIHTVHGWSFHNRTPNKTKMIYKFLEKVTAKITDRLIVVTEKDSEKGIMENIASREKFKIIRSGIDFSKFYKNESKEIKDFKNRFKGKKIVATIGRLSEQKNTIDFMKIVKMISRKRDDIHFIVIGDGELREQLEMYIKTNQIENNVTMLGAKDNVIDYYYIMDVFVLTSLWEGLPRVIPEAMACGVPVVANAVDGVSDIMKDGINGYLIKPDDLGNAAVKIEKLIDEVKLKVRIVNSAYDTIRPEFDAENMMLKTEEVYKELCELKSTQINKKAIKTKTK